MSRSRSFHPADYNLVAHPSRPKTNSPLRVLGALLLAFVVCAVAWQFMRGPVRVSRPTLELLGPRVVATAVATNETDRPVRLSLRVVLGRVSPGIKRMPPRFEVVDQQDVEAVVAPHSESTVRCEFPLPRD